MSFFSECKAAEEYSESFRKEFGFESLDDLNSSHDINDINVKIADMMIRRGYYKTSSTSPSPSIVYDFAVSQHPQIVENTCLDGLFQKLVVSDDTMSDLKAYGSYQPIWDFAFAYESCARHNPIAFAPPEPYIGFILQKNEEYTYPLDLTTVDDQSYYIDGMDGYDTPENYDCEQIAANLTNAGIRTPIFYDGDYRKIIEYSVDFENKEKRKDYIDTIMSNVGTAIFKLAYRKPTANPYDIQTFQWLLRDTIHGNLIQMPVLPEIKGGA